MKQEIMIIYLLGYSLVLMPDPFYQAVDNYCFGAMRNMV